MDLITRLSWHAHRTPLIHPAKALRRALAPRTISRHRELARAIGEDAHTSALGRTLNEQGYVVVTDAIGPTELAALQSAGDSKLARIAEAEARQTSRRKDFWVRLLDEDMIDGRLPTDNPFVSFALQRPVLRILASALGELPNLDYVLLTYSKPTDKPLAASQLWHRDYDDVRTLKLFAYLTDVKDIGQGPFTFIPGPASDRVGFTRKTHRADEEVFGDAVKSTETIEVKAPRASVFMVETSRCLHMGSRLAPGNERLLYTATFTTAPRMYPTARPVFRLTGSEDAAVRCVLHQSARNNT